MRVLVRTVAPVDEAFYERTVGQVSDLPVELRKVADAELEETTTERLARARELASDFEATVVVWFEHQPNANTRIFIADPAHDRVLVRTVASESDAIASSSSAMLEASSLVVRTALLALDSGAPLGIPNDDLTRPAPAPPREPDEASTPAEQRSAPSARWSPSFGAGWQLTLDGWSPAGAHAATLDAGVCRNAWCASLRGAFGLPSRSQDGNVALEISRHAAGVSIARTVARGEIWQIDLGAGAGVVVFRRSASQLAADFSPSPPATHVSPAGSLDLRVYWWPTRTSPLQLGASVGADVLATPPSFGYTTPSGFVEQRTWFIEPRGGVFVSLRAQ
ncbi:hypothetical protein AKJ09_05761 [Labilithrix luteola]|uniref:Uncharacterized protein n=1 Tax=Labilithrix luteola TaxID=1391654 RepID=A0A0K1Q023_9BACT|nr:hypothetical protein AKJ09_05761 [Labilithrix luteola]